MPCTRPLKIGDLEEGIYVNWLRIVAIAFSNQSK
jgi:hypothetical protein